jgi:DNA-binding NtrC family response regulator
MIVRQRLNVRPRVLVIDDLMGMDKPTKVHLQSRADYCRALGLRDEATSAEPGNAIVADAFISSGQRVTGAAPVNSIELVEEVFLAGWPAPSGRYWSAALVDLKFGEDEHFGLRIIERLHRLAPELPIIAISSLNQLQMRAGETLRDAVERLGAQDFLATYGVDFDVEREYRSTPDNLGERLERVGLIPDPEQKVVGVSLAVCRLLKELRALIPKDVVGQMLLLGEAGSGKSHLSNYVQRRVAHQQGRKLQDVAYRPIALTGTSEEMQRVTLFGTEGATHVKPARGYFEDAADRGLIFLDEIAELTQGSQGELLGPLQPQTAPDGSRYREAIRTRGRLPYQSRCFVMAATNRDLEEMARQRLFSAALLQRFHGRTVQIPLLRERKGDLPLLVDYFVSSVIHAHGTSKRPRLDVSSGAWERFGETHSIRQLSALIEGTISTNPFKGLLTEEDFFRQVKPAVFATGETTQAVAADEERFEVADPEPIAEDTAQGSVSSLVNFIDSWVPSSQIDAQQFDRAFERLDAAFAKAKLRLWRDLVARQKALTGRVNLLASVKQLLGKEDIPNSKPGDLAVQIFNEARIDKPPDDPMLSEIWDRRRGTSRKQRQSD